MNHTIKAISKFKETVTTYNQVEVKNRIATIYFNRCPVQFKTRADYGIYIKSSFMEGVYIPSKVDPDTLPDAIVPVGTGVSFKLEPQNVQGLSEFLYNKKHNISNHGIVKYATFQKGYAIATNGHTLTRRKTDIDPAVSFRIEKDKLILLEKLSREGVLDATLYDNCLAVSTIGDTIGAIIELNIEPSESSICDGALLETQSFLEVDRACSREIAITELLEAVKSFVLPISAFKKEPAVGETLPVNVLVLAKDIMACPTIKSKRTLSSDVVGDVPMYFDIDLLLTGLNEMRGSVGNVMINAVDGGRSVKWIVIKSDSVEVVVCAVSSRSEYTYDTFKDYNELLETVKPAKKAANAESVKALKAEIESLRTALGAAREQIKSLTATVESHPKVRRATLSQARYIARSKRMTFEEAGKLSILEAHELINTLVAEKCNNLRDRLQAQADAEEEKEEAQA